METIVIIYASFVVIVGLVSIIWMLIQLIHDIRELRS